MTKKRSAPEAKPEDRRSPAIRNPYPVKRVQAAYRLLAKLQAIDRGVRRLKD
jgi:hypothetical protein